MLGDMFETEDDLLAGGSSTVTQIAGASQRRAKSCAGWMDLPSMAREEFGFIGLKNQGATCYLNSLVQCLFMSPEFRDAIFKLQLCDGDDITKKSEFIDSQSKFKLLFGFQKMFAQMQGLNIRSVSTEELTASFGWEANQGFEQQDIQETNRVIFDVLERALFGMPVEVDPSKYYRGTVVNHITCTECQVPREREENFFDLILQVDGVGSIEESLMAFISPELLDQDNQLFCEICGKKSDTLKGQKIRKFPDILTVSLNRFKFDMEKLDRVKVNSEFEFGLELNIAPFVEDADLDDTSDECNYELFTVLIHRGSAHGGHYHTYIRDQFGEGNWHEKMKLYEVDRVKREAERKEAAVKAQKLAEEKEAAEREIKEKKRAQQEQEAKQKKEAALPAQGEEESAERSTGKRGGKKDKSEQSQQQQESQAGGKKKRDRNDEGAAEKGKKKQQQKQSKKDQNQGEASHEGAGEDAAAAAKKKKDEGTKGMEDFEFDDKEFPREFRNVDLREGWYDFNDSIVSSIRVNRLQKQFGGSGSENAYILVYRKKALAKKLVVPTLPSYLKTYIDTENARLKAERDAYEDALQHIEITLHVGSEVLLDATMQTKKGYDYEKEGQRVRLHRDSTYSNMLARVQEVFVAEIEDLVMIEVFEHTNGYLQVVEAVSADEKGSSAGEKTTNWMNERTLRETEVSHMSSWVVYDRKKSAEVVQRLSALAGQDNIPLKLNIIQAGRSEVVLMYSQDKLQDLKTRLNALTGIPEHEMYITTEGLVHLNSSEEKDELTLVALKITNDSDLILKQIDEQTAKELKQLESQADEKDGKKKLSEYQQAQLDGLVSVLVESSDEQGVRRFFIDYRSMTLRGLLEYLKEKFEVDGTSARRLRNLETSQLYYEDEYARELSNLSCFEEGGTRLRLERGEIPVSGNIPIRFKNQSTLLVSAASASGESGVGQVEATGETIVAEDAKKEGGSAVVKEVEILISSDKMFAELKEQACVALGLSAADHRVYKCDWLEEPVQLIANENQVIRNMQFKNQEVLVIRDHLNPINKEFERFTVYLSTKGTSEELASIGDVKIRKDETLLDLKNLILITPELLKRNEDGSITAAHIRIRDMRKDGLLGQIYRHNDKKISSNVYSTNNIAVQIMSEVDTLEEDDIVMVLRKRDCEKRTYGEDVELVFRAGKKPSVADLKASVASLVKVENPEEIHLVKYFPYEFSWTLISDAEYERLKEKKNAIIKPLKGGSQPPQKKKQQQQQSGKGDATDKGTTEVSEVATKAIVTADQNVKKPPYLIKDGDILGYIVKSQQKPGQEADYQTESDAQMKMWFEEEKRLKKAGVANSKKKGDGGGFKMNLDF